MDENSDLHEEEAFQEEEQILTELLIDEEVIIALLNRADLSSAKLKLILYLILKSQRETNSS